VIRNRWATSEMLADHHGEALVDPADRRRKARRPTRPFAVRKMGAITTANPNLSKDDLLAVDAGRNVLLGGTKDFHQFRSNETKEFGKPVFIFVCCERNYFPPQRRDGASFASNIPLSFLPLDPSSPFGCIRPASLLKMLLFRVCERFARTSGRLNALFPVGITMRP